MARNKSLRLWLTCEVCKRPASRQCDYKLRSGFTCNRGLCSLHTVSAGPGVDRCPGHPAQLVAPPAALEASP